MHAMISQVSVWHTSHAHAHTNINTQFYHFKQAIVARKQSSEVDFLMMETLCSVIDRLAFQRGCLCCISTVELPRRKMMGRRN